MGEQSQLALLDAGAIYLRAIYRRCAELGARPDVLPLNASDEQLRHYKAFIISGSGSSVNQDAPAYNPSIFDGSRPALGLCYGMQLMNKACGGTVVSAKGGLKEYGQTYVSADPQSLLFKGLGQRHRVLMSHGDSVDVLAQGFRQTGSSGGLVAAMENAEKRLYGVQFHPEMIPITKHGREMFENFLYGIAGLDRGKEVTVDDLIGESIKYVKDNVRDDEHVFMLLSGGVDSTVSLKLVSEALGPARVHGLIMDTGFMREGEPDAVFDYLYSLKQGRIEMIGAADEFLNASTEVKGRQYSMSEAINSEVKRAIFRGAYKQVALDFLERHKADMERDWIVQGTLATDIAESGVNRKKIKTHHNVGLGFKKELTPLQYMHKDEVRAAARALGLPEEVAKRQPFPGPGLMLRVPCATEPVMLDNYEESDRRVREIAREHGLDGMLLPIQTVGIQGDDRTYTHPVLLWGPRDWNAISQAADIIPRQVHIVNRVEYLLNAEEPKTRNPNELITKTMITPETVALVRQADAVLNKLQAKHGLEYRITQMPGCVLPINLGVPGSRMFSIRPMFTPDFYAGMPGSIAQRETDLPADERDEFIPEEFLNELTQEIRNIPGLPWVSICRSAKPPTTTEPE